MALVMGAAVDFLLQICTLSAVYLETKEIFPPGISVRHLNLTSLVGRCALTDEHLEEAPSACRFLDSEIRYAARLRSLSCPYVMPTNRPIVQAQYDIKVVGY